MSDRNTEYPAALVSYSNGPLKELVISNVPFSVFKIAIVMAVLSNSLMGL